MVDKGFLDRVYIAKPCDAKWEDMQGDERARMCSLCSKNVYNISDMPRKQAEEFLARNGASACTRFYRRRDGTIITDECPVGLRKIRNAVRFVARAAATVLSFAISMPIMLAKDSSNQNSIRQWEVAQNPLDGKRSGQSDSRDSAWTRRYNYFLRFPACGGEAGFADATNFGLPDLPKLLTGKHALKKDEICESDGDIFLRIAEASIAHDPRWLRSNTAVDKLDKKMTAAEAFKRAQAQEQSQQFKTAELYYKLTLKYFDEYHRYDQKFQRDVVARYTNLLRQWGRVSEAKTLEEEYNASGASSGPLATGPVPRNRIAEHDRGD